MEHIRVRSCTLKVKNDKYTIYEIEDHKGNKYDYNEICTPGDVIECEIIPDATGKGYNPKLKRKMANKAFYPKDTKRETALLCAVKFPKALSSAEVLLLADKYYAWLIKK